MSSEEAHKQLIDIRPLVAKIGHELEDIRIRALQNIISKYENGIIQLEEIVHQRQLMVNLLQWFNFPDPKCIKDVLGLLGSISQNSNGANLLCHLGTVEFMGMMLQDTTDPSIKELIEKLLENLFMSHTSYEDEGNSIGFDDTPFTSNKNIVSSNTSPRSAVEIIHECSKRTVENQQQIVNHAVIPSNNNIEIQDMKEPNQSEVYHQEVEFHWIPLTISDRSILSVTENRLLSGDTSIMTQSCEFFRDVLVQDFPSELFLQRPNLIKALLACLKTYGLKSGLAVIMPLLQCFNELISKLSLRFNDFLIDELNPMWPQDARTSKQSSVVSLATTQSSSLQTNASPSTVNNDSHSPHAVPGSNGEESNYDEFEGDLLTEALKNQEWSPCQLALLTMSHCLPLFSSSPKYNTINAFLLQLLRKTIHILKHYNLRIKWDARNILKDPYSYKYELSTVLDGFGKFIFEITKNIQNSSLDSIILETHVALLMEYAIDLIDTVVPMDAIQGFIPRPLFDAMKTVTFNYKIVSNYPLLKDKIKTVSALLDQGFASLNDNIALVKISIFKLHYFTSADCKKMDNALLETWEDANTALPFVDALHFIRKALHVVKSIYKDHGLSIAMKTKSIQLILGLFKHEQKNVAVSVHSETLELIKESLSDSLVLTPWSLKYKDINWLVQFPILKQLCYDSLFSRYSEIKEISQGLFVRLLLSQLDMDASVWHTLITNLIPLLPYLQASMGTDASLDNALIHTFVKSKTSSMLTADGKSWTLPPLVEIIFSLTMMLSKVSSIRKKGFQFATELLLKADKDEEIHVRYQRNTDEKPYNLFVQDTYFHESYINDLIGSTSVDRETVIEICSCINVNRNVESRKNAVIQLATISKDRKWDDIIIGSNVIDVVQDEFHNSLVTNYGDTYTQVILNPNKEILSSCVSILSNFAVSSNSIRLQLASNRRIYFDILRSLLSLSSSIPDLHFNLLRLLVTLLFSSVRAVECDIKDEFTLPKKIVNSYCLPVRFSEFAMEKGSKDLKTKPLSPEMFTESIMTLLKEHSVAIHDNLVLSDINRIPIDDSEWTSLMANSLISHTANENLILIKAAFNNISRDTVESQLIGYQQLMALVQSHAIQCVHHATPFCIHSQMMSHWGEENLNSRIFRDLQTSEMSKVEENRVQLLAILLSAILDSPCLRAVDAIRLISSSAEYLYNSNGRVKDLKSNSLSSHGANEGPNNYARKQLQLHLRLLIHLASSINKHSVSLPKQLIQFIIRTLTESLHVVQAESHYDLPTLEVTLECLTHLTAVHGWSNTFNEVDARPTVEALVTSLKQILLSFHANQANASVSFMGKGVVYRTAQALCHVFAEAQKSQQIDEVIIRNALLDDAHGSLNWLTTLFKDRTYEVRWSAWSIATAIGLNFGWSVLIKSEVKLHSGGLWAIAVETVMSREETVAVRCQAAYLLNSLCEAAISEAGKDLWTTMIVEDLFTESVLIGKPAFTVLLQHFQFFEMLNQIFIPGTTRIINEENTNDTLSSRGITSSLSDNTQSSCDIPYKEIEATQSGVKKALLHSRDSTQSGTTSTKSRDTVDDSSVLSNYDEGSFYGQLLSRKIDRAQLKFKWHLLTFLNKLTQCLDIRYLSSVIEEINLIDLLQSLLDAPGMVSAYSEIQLQPELTTQHDLQLRCRIKIHNESILFFYHCVQSLDIKHDFNIKAIVELFNVSIKGNDPLSTNLIRLVSNTARLLNLILRQNKDKQNNVIDELKLQFCNVSNCLLSIFKHDHCTNISSLIELMLMILTKGEWGDFDQSIPMAIIDPLCRVLCSIWRDGNLRQSDISCYGYRCLCQLLSMSELAKQSMISSGKLKEIIVEFSGLNETLETASLVLDKEANGPRQEKKIVGNAITILCFLKSIAYRSETIKNAIIKERIMNTLSVLWQWSKVYNDMSCAIVDFLTVLSAHCTNGQKELCRTSYSFESPSILSQIINSLTKVYNGGLTAKEAPSTQLLSGFSLLINASQATECRALIWKSGFLHLFSRLISSTPSSNPRTKKNHDLYLLSWLNLVLVLSFYNESAKLILKMPDFLSFLVHYSTSNKKALRHRSLLICRNLLFVTGSKQSFLSNDYVVSSLLNAVDYESIETKALALSALWQMLADNKKAVAVLRKSTLPVKLQTLGYQIQSGKLLSLDVESELYAILKRALNAVSIILTKKSRTKV